MAEVEGNTEVLECLARMAKKAAKNKKKRDRKRRQTAQPVGQSGAAQRDAEETEPEAEDLLPAPAEPLAQAMEPEPIEAVEEEALELLAAVSASGPARASCPGSPPLLVPAARLAPAAGPPPPALSPPHLAELHPTARLAGQSGASSAPASSCSSPPSWPCEPGTPALLCSPAAWPGCCFETLAGNRPSYLTPAVLLQRSRSARPVRPGNCSAFVFLQIFPGGASARMT